MMRRHTSRHKEMRGTGRSDTCEWKKEKAFACLEDLVVHGVDGALETRVVTPSSSRRTKRQMKKMTR